MFTLQPKVKVKNKDPIFSNATQATWLCGPKPDTHLIFSNASCVCTTSCYLKMVRKLPPQRRMWREIFLFDLIKKIAMFELNLPLSGTLGHTTHLEKDPTFPRYIAFFKSSLHRASIPTKCCILT